MKEGMRTRLVHLGSQNPVSVSRPKSLPITMSSVFVFDDVETLDQVYGEEAPGYVYSRNGNPVHDALKEMVAGIDGGEAGGVYASGMAAITLSVLAHVQAGDHVLAANVLYGVSFAFLKEELKRFQVEVTFVDPINDELDRHFRPNTKLVYVETISNPMMEVVDLERVAQAAHQHGAKLIVDNTFAAPVVCRPLEWGADVVVYSATKYFCGHSDVTGGAVVSDGVTMERIESLGAMYGPMMSPFDAWLLIRSMRTLELRMRQHCTNALELASYLDSHPNIQQVYYPGLMHGETHETGKRLFDEGLFGGMLSFDLAGGEKAAYQLVKDLERIKLVPSLAGVSTTLSYPAKTSHRAMNEEELKRAGISAGTLRLSTGLENMADIMNELAKALNRL